jgi:hypothetical protein
VVPLLVGFVARHVLPSIALSAGGAGSSDPGAVSSRVFPP